MQSGAENVTLGSSEADAEPVEPVEPVVDPVELEPEPVVEEDPCWPIPVLTPSVVPVPSDETLAKPRSAGAAAN